MLSYDDGIGKSEYGADQRGLISGLYAKSAYAPGSELAKHSERRKDLDCAANRHILPRQGRKQRIKFRSQLSKAARQDYEKSEALRRWRAAVSAMKS
jgi:hypothetical protein